MELVLWKNIEAKVVNKAFRFRPESDNPNSPEVLAIWVGGKADGSPVRRL